MSLDMHSVTELATLGNYSDLNANTAKESEEKYLEQIANTLSQCEYNDTRLGGGFVRVFHPVVNGVEFENIAVKFVKMGSLGDKNVILEMFEGLDNQTVEQILHDKTLFLSLNHDEQPPGKDDLLLLEKELIWIIAEHKKYEQLYGEYVLPSVFVSFNLKKSICDIHGEVFKSSNTVVGAMVQNFEGKVRVIGKNPWTERDFTDWDTLTPEEVDNVWNFMLKMKDVFFTRGYYPDPGNLLRGNLGLLEDGRVVLLDTNCLYKAETSFDTAKVNKMMKEIEQKVKKYKQKHV